jgi:hypothetical protein
MAKVTIYLDQMTKEKACDAARSQGLSLSKWITERIRKSIAIDWPQSVRELAGAWSDFASIQKPIKRSGRDAKRLKF